MKPAEFNFPEIDEIGIETLDAISFAPRFNKWMYETIKKHCSGNILEVGSGIGNISHHFINDNYSIELSDIRDNYLDILKDNYGGQVADIFKMDLTDPEFNRKFEHKFDSYDTVFALNVIEHIEDDTLAIKNAKKLLKKDGRIIILVPAFQLLYNSFDTALEHYRRYTLKKLNTLLETEFLIQHSQYFNAFGMLGWFVSGKILKKKSIPKNQMQLYDKLLFVAKMIDKLVINKIGLSVISVGKKQQ